MPQSSRLNQFHASIILARNIVTSRLIMAIPLLFGLSCDAPIDPDTTAPEVTVSYPVDGRVVADLVTISVNATDESGVTSVEINIDGQLMNPDTEAPWQYEWDTAEYGGETQHTILARAYDEAGNVGTSDLVTVTTESIPMLSVSPLSLIFGSDVTVLALTISNSGTGSIAWSITDDQDWITVDPDTGTTTDESDGVVVTAGLLQETSTGNITVTPNTGDAISIPVSRTGWNNVPVMNSIIASLDLVTAGGTVTFTADADDDDGDTLTYTYSSAGGTFSGATWTAPTNGDGVYTISVVANDGIEDSDAAITTVVVATVPAMAAQWSFNIDGRDGIGMEHLAYGGTTSITASGKVGGAIVFALEENGDLSGAAFGPSPSGLSMEADAAYTFSLWISTNDDKAFLFGKTYDGNYTPDPVTENPEIGSAKGIFIADWAGEFGDQPGVIFENSWINGHAFEGNVHDGAWHNVVVTKTDADIITIYVDGVGGDPTPDPFGTSPDGNQSITFGSAIEEDIPEYGYWPFALDGIIDEAIFFQSALSAAEVSAIYDAHQ